MNFPGLPFSASTARLTATVAPEKARPSIFSESGVVGLVPHFREKEGGQVLGEALAAVRSVKEEGVRAALLAELAPRLPEAEQQRVLAEVVSAARAMLPGKAQAQALAGISRYLSQAEQREVLKDTLACARRIPGNKAREEALLDG